MLIWVHLLDGRHAPKATGSILAILLTALASCAPVYIPAAVLAPLHAQRGDKHAAVNAGLNGLQAGASYAASDSVAVRGGLQANGGNNDSSTYRMGTAGVSLFHAQPHGPLRTAGSLEIGGGSSVGQVNFRLNDNSNKIRYSGDFLRIALQGDVGLSTQYLSAGLATRLVNINFWNDAASTDTGTANWWFAEPVLFFRAGAIIKLDLQFGLSLPVSGTGNLGGWVPLVFALGLVADF